MQSDAQASPLREAIKPGTRYAGRFAIQTQIGASPLGLVYQAKSPGGEVALRVLWPELTEVEGLTPYLRSLAKRLRAVEHPGLTPLYRFGVSAGQMYAAHTLRAGGSLADRLDEHERLPVSAALDLVAALAPPLTALHGHNLLHSNVQPSNIVFDAEGQPSLTDARLPAVIERAVRTLDLGMELDVPLYQAPEQIAGRPADARSDQYSLAAVLFRLLTGLPPFEADSLEHLTELQLTQGAPAPVDFNSDAPRRVSEAVQRALEFTREQRFDTLDDFLTALGVTAPTPLVIAPPPKPPPEEVPAEPEVTAPPEPVAPPTLTLPPLELDQRFGRFDVHELLGQTELNLVYRATDRAARREVALKILADEFKALPQFEKYFLSVVKRFNQIEHPHLVPLLRAGKIEGRLFYSVGLMPGGTLQDRLAGGPLEVDEAIAILQDIGPALSFLHQQGLVHLDIKPSNILFDETGRAWLSETGLSPMLSAAAASFAVPSQRGTFDYQSPEQLAGRSRSRKLDTRSDVYSMGVLFFHMLTGRTPYHAENAHDLAELQFSQPVPAARELLPDGSAGLTTGLDKGIDEALRVALSFDRNSRFETVAEMMAAVTGVVPAELPASDVIAPLPPGAEPRPETTLEILERLAPEVPVADVYATVSQAQVDALVAAAAVAAAPRAAVAPPVPRPALRWIFAAALFMAVAGVVGVIALVATSALPFRSSPDDPSVAGIRNSPAALAEATLTATPTETPTASPTATNTPEPSPTASPTPPPPTATPTTPPTSEDSEEFTETGEALEGVLEDVQPGAAPPESVEPSALSDEELAVVDEIIAMLNERRRDNNLAALVVDEPLSSAAQARANDMVTRHYFSHYDPETGEPLAFVVAAVVGFDAGTYVGENLGRTLLTLPEASASLVGAWMESTAHRTNLLAAEFDFIGVGIAFDDTTSHWVVTTLFASKFAVAEAGG